MRIFISGGCKNGKSTLAQNLACAQGAPRVYIATMKPRDREDDARVLRHRAERAGLGFETVEISEGLDALIGRYDAGASLLVDSVTALVAEMMFGGGERFDPDAGCRAARELSALADAYPNIVMVSDAIFADADAYGDLTERYRRALASADRALARRFDAVLEMTFGVPIMYKGDERVAALVREAVSGVFDGAGPVHGTAGLCPLG